MNRTDFHYAQDVVNALASNSKLFTRRIMTRAGIGVIPLTFRIFSIKHDYTHPSKHTSDSTVQYQTSTHFMRMQKKLTNSS